MRLRNDGERRDRRVKRPCTRALDAKILKLYEAGAKDPKTICKVLKLSNVWRVYDAIRRRKSAFSKILQIKSVDSCEGKA